MVPMATVIAGPIDSTLEVAYAYPEELFDQMVAAAAPAAPPPRQKRERAAHSKALFASKKVQQEVVTPAPPRPIPVAVSTESPSGQTINPVPSQRELLQELVGGGFGALVRHNLKGLGVPPLDAALIARLRLTADGSPSEPDRATADQQVLASRAAHAARLATITAEEQTARIQKDIYVLEDFPSVQTATGLRRYFHEDEARAASGIGSSEPAGVHHHYHLAQHLEVWTQAKEHNT